MSSAASVEVRAPSTAATAAARAPSAADGAAARAPLSTAARRDSSPAFRAINSRSISARTPACGKGEERGLPSVLRLR